MSNGFYNVSGAPVTGSQGASAVIRSEYALIAAAFDKMPALTPNTLVCVNAGGTALTNVSTSAAVLTFLGSASSANLAAAMTDETGSGSLVFGTSPTIIGTIAGSPQITGTPTNNSASTGNIGEYISAIVLVGSEISLTSNTPADITSISLTAGDWDVSGIVTFDGSFSAAIGTYAWVSTSSATVPTRPLNGMVVNHSGTAATADQMATGTVRISISSTTPVYLSTNVIFNSGTATAYGFIRARRTR